MISWDRCRSFLLRADRSFHLWVGRLPEWGFILLLPLIVFVVTVEWACWFRRTTAAVAVTFVAIYVSLIRSAASVFSWGEVLASSGRFCIAMVGVLYFMVLLMVAEQKALWWLQEALWPSKETKESAERTGDGLPLWDREIDG